MQCPLVQLKFQSPREACRHPASMGICVSLIYQVSSSFGSWCGWTKQGGQVNLRFYLFVSGVNHIEWEREVSPRFPFVNPGIWELRLRPTACDVEWFSVCGMFADIKSKVVRFCFIGSWCYSEWWGWNLRIFAQFQVSEIFPELFQDFIDGHVKP